MPPSPLSLCRSSIVLAHSSGPSQASGDNFQKRERGEEERYVRSAEAEKLKALGKSIEASKAHLAQVSCSHPATRDFPIPTIHAADWACPPVRLSSSRRTTPSFPSRPRSRYQPTQPISQIVVLSHAKSKIS